MSRSLVGSSSTIRLAGLATSTIALDGRGRAVETPGGWQDFTRQNPGFFAPAYGAAQQAITQALEAPKGAAKPPTAKGKLTFKDTHRLGELETLVPRLTDQIRTLEERLHDPGLYARDKAGFDRLMQELDAVRASLAAAENEWLSLEEKRESLSN